MPISGQSGAIAFLARRHARTVLRPRCLRFAADRTVWNGGPRPVFRAGLVTTDLAILKDIMVREGYRFQLRAEFTNAFNQVNFNNPVASIANARYGEITGSQAGRVIQVGLKFVW